MINILAHSPVAFDGTSFYRAYGVFPNLSKQLNREVSITDFRGGFTWPNLGPFDVLFLQRPQTAAIYKLALYARSIGIKVWVDYDDNLFSLPPESRALFDMTNETRKVMMDTMLAADVVTVSTDGLKEFFTQNPNLKNIEVVPNALNDDWGQPVIMHNAESPTIVWRGSETHVADLAYFNGEIIRAIEATEDTFHFMGYCPWLIAHEIPIYVPEVFGSPKARVHCHKPEDIKIYNENLQKLRPRLMHVPLLDNDLNQAKSNIAWMEATFAGAVCIAPDWPEWRRPGVLLYKNNEEYEALLKSKEDYTENWKLSIAYIKENLMLSTVNKKRVEILLRLVAGRNGGYTATGPEFTTTTTEPVPMFIQP